MKLQIAYAAVLLLLAQAFPANPPKPKQSLEGMKAVNSVLAEPSEARIAVTANASWSADGPVLRFTFRNTSSTPLKMWRAWLPWGNSNAVEVAAFSSAGQPLETYWPIDDPAPPDQDEPITIAPGAKLSGTFHLLNRIPTIADQTNDVLVVWAYRLVLAGNEPSGQVSGAASLRKMPAPNSR